MKKKILIPVITAAIMGFAAIGASARNLDMYVNNHHVVRDIQTVGRFDMLPVLDIAGELGFNCSFDGTTIKLYNDSRSYKFTMGKAAAYDQDGKWYGLDVVPQIINGSVRIPYKFFCDAMGLSYTWDDVTSTIFLGSDRTYNWLINTEEYKLGSINDGYLNNGGTVDDDRICVWGVIMGTGYLRSLNHTVEDLKTMYNIPNADIVRMEGDEIYYIIPKYKNSKVIICHSNPDLSPGVNGSRYIDGEITYSGNRPVILICNRSCIFPNSKVRVEYATRYTEFRPIQQR